MSESNGNEGDFLDAALEEGQASVQEQQYWPEPDYSGQQEEPNRTVPLPTFLDMRDKAKASEARLAELEARLAQAQFGSQNPEQGLAEQDLARMEQLQQQLAEEQQAEELQAQELQAQQMYVQQHLAHVDNSLTMVQQHLGEEAFSEAYATARANPEVAHYILTHPSPGDALLELHQTLQRHKIMERVPADQSFDDWILQEAARLSQQRLSQQSPFAASQQNLPLTRAPLPSLAGAKGGGAPAGAPLLSEDPIDDLLA